VPGAGGPHLTAGVDAGGPGGRSPVARDGIVGSTCAGDRRRRWR